MTELAALHAKITGDESSLQAAIRSSVGLVERFSNSAQKSARVFEREFAKSEKAVDRLRKAIDPVYAASKRYEAAVQTLDAALGRGTLTEAQHAAALDKASAAYLGTGAAAASAAGKIDATSGVLGRLGSMSGSAQAKLANLGYQVQDAAVQLAAGTSAATVFAQQGSQVASVFGPMGIAIGTVAAVALPLLGAAFAAAGGKAKTFAETVDALKASLDRVNEIARVYSGDGLEEMRAKYGEINAEILAMRENQRQFAINAAMDDARAAIAALSEEFGHIPDSADKGLRFTWILAKNLGLELGLTKEQVYALGDALRVAAAAETVEDWSAALRTVNQLLSQSEMATSELAEKIIEAEDYMRQLAAAAPKAGWLNAAIGQAQTLAGAIWAAVSAKAAFFGSGAGAQVKSDKLNAFAKNRAGVAGYGSGFDFSGLGGDGGGGGGGGGGQNPVVADLESLRQTLLSQEEVQLASFARQQETLQAALEQRLLTQEDYAALMEAAQAAHQDRMAGIDAMRYGDGLQKAGAYFGAMADAMAGGNEKMAKAAKVFGAIEATINAHRAANQAMADPTVPFWGKLAARMAVLSAGMQTVAAIKGTGGSGGSYGSAASATTTSAAAASGPAQVSLNTYGFGDMIRTADLGTLFRRLQEEYGDRGYVMGLRA